MADVWNPNRLREKHVSPATRPPFFSSARVTSLTLTGTALPNQSSPWLTSSWDDRHLSGSVSAWRLLNVNTQPPLPWAQLAQVRQLASGKARDL